MAQSLFPRHSLQSSFRIFHTSLSFVAYDSMEFHLTRPCEGDIEDVKEIPSLFLSACGKCRMPRVSMRVSSGAVNGRKIFREIYNICPEAHAFEYANFSIPRKIFIGRLRRFESSVYGISIDRQDWLRIFTARLTLNIHIVCWYIFKRRKRQRETFRMKRM